MKQMLTAGLASMGFLASSAGAATINVPDSCFPDILDTGICVTGEEPQDEPGSQDVVAYVLLYKSDFPTIEAAIDQFFDWGNWQAYYDKADFKKTSVVSSIKMLPLDTTDKNGAPVRYLRNYFHFSTKVPIIGNQYVRGISLYQDISQGGIRSFQYHLAQGAMEVPPGENPLDGSEGLAKQEGLLQFMECDQFDFCTDEEIMVHYKMRLRHKIPIMAGYAVQFAKEQVNALMTGMYLRE